jgi:hypothetical protein
MDPLTRYEATKLRMAERLQDAARVRMVTGGRALECVGEDKTSVLRRWTGRQIVGRIRLAIAHA